MLSKQEIKNLKQFQKKIRYKFRSIKYLHHALIHSSYVNENPELNLTNNETLEFLGDAVLGLIITEYLYKQFTDYSEGKLSIIKSMLVNEQTLAELSKNFELGDFIYLGKGENKESTRGRASILSNTLEALIAAVYLDAGYKAVNKFIHRLYLSKFKEIPGMELRGSYKNRLQQYTQAEYGSIPVYEIISEIGPSHKKIYEVNVSFQDKVRGYGKGTSKKRAEQNAARDALEKLGTERF